MKQTELIPYLFQAMVEQAGGIVDFEAAKVLESIKSEKMRLASFTFVEGGILRVELVDEDEVSEN